ncbi:hypothetical protein HKBW3S03_00464 [Candidatus Hakubella thermalkaliphila]|uniref:Uncharacterized protein n=1 Tax=Candidatus Hakubella thermalkaliphila TaxID=2754717 RepID=A0A6V8Q984_9ACTN|nr:hypothetical protein [Candidatus Hakubella thermalkaliphila]MBT9169831.1 hypothetical protein [Actinomycetota bacterium]GFP18960.1 hypothetical protein HKBW3S03_00464 [Candidatus Hakubella thermalkaliphila]GFP20962.1 hypothetical protein HKBW3S06_00189 [Candidatus Hakubella thermalkaliphila]GFP29462.1 hypothetical protein HKBW3S34_00382 [Candidatus Hakubella thermalkaliphila]GFP36825.1 hypothetical protein HKBW3S44_00506 [Candidatus Hakubella thermalkaliphila]
MSATFLLTVAVWQVDCRKRTELLARIYGGGQNTGWCVGIYLIPDVSLAGFPSRDYRLSL